MDAPIPTRRGRKPNNPARTFCARMLADIRGITEQHAADLLAEDPESAPAGLWQMAHAAVAEGITEIPAFDLWLMEEARRRISKS